MYRTYLRIPDTGTARIPERPANRPFPNNPRTPCRAAPFRLILLLAAALLAGQPLMAPAAETITWPGSALTPLLFWGADQDALVPSTASPTHNTVTVSGGDPIASALGGFSSDPGVEVSDNQVFITAGQVYRHVTGGGSYSGNVVRNKVEITGGTVSGAVYGGYSDQGNATGNTVNISGNPTLGSLRGGSAGTGNDGFTGNTLNFSADPVTVAVVENFQHYSFTLDSASPSVPLITADTIVLGSGGTSSEIKVTGFRPSGQTLQVNDTFVLMEATADLTNNGIAASWTNTFQQGSRIYDVETRVVGGGSQLIATTTGIRSASAPATAIPALPAPLMMMLAVAAGLLGRRHLRQRS